MDRGLHILIDGERLSAESASGLSFPAYLQQPRLVAVEETG